MTSFPTISRRTLLMLGGAAVTPGVAGATIKRVIRGRSASGGGTSAPLVGPHASWNGTAGSGQSVTPTVHADRTGPMAIVRFLDVSYQRISGDYTVRLVAGAFDGIASVTLKGDCAQTTVVSRQTRTYTDVNGRTRLEKVWDFTINHSAFISKHANGNTVNLYATATPTNGSVQARTIGPLVLHPESVQHDWTATVSSNGLDDSGAAAAAPTYTSLGAALTAARTAVAGGPSTCGKITIVKTSNYEAPTLSGFNDPGRGYLVVTHAPGTVATIGRASFSANDSDSWRMLPGWNGIEWRGAGIVFEHAKMTSHIYQNSSARPPWYNGCKLIDSNGRDHLWNKGSRDSQTASGIGPQGDSSTGLESYFTDVYFEGGPAPFGSQILAVGCQTNQTFGDIYSNTPVVYGTTDKDANSSWFRTYIDAVTIAWNGTPGQGTVSKNGNTITVHDPSGDLVISSWYIPNSGDYDMTDLKTKMEAHNANWSVTVLDNTRRQSFLIGDTVGGGLNGWSAYAFSSTPTTIKTFIDVHGDLWQGPHGGADCENVVLSYIHLYGDVNLSQAFNFDGRNQWDMLCEGNILNDNNSSTGVTSATQHLVFIDSFQKSGITIDAGADPWCDISGNIFGSMGLSGSPWPTGPRIRRNAYATGSPPTSGNTSDNLSVASLASILPGLATGDYRPAGALLTNLITKTSNDDVRGNTRNASTARGPYEVGGSAVALPY